MPEESQPQNEEMLIQLPSALRIRQRLGQISANNLFQQQLVPRLEQLGGAEFTPERFLAQLALELSEFAEAHMLGMTALAYNHMPRIIDQLVTDTEQKTATLNLWEQLIIDTKERDEAETRALKLRYTHPAPKLSRKQKRRRRGHN